MGAMIGTFMPWQDQAHSVAFSLMPWTYVFFVVILPDTFVPCAIFFSVAALTRSFALTCGAAMGFCVADLFLNVYAMIEPGTWASRARGFKGRSPLLVFYPLQGRRMSWPFCG
jgi:hypothetical protein